MQNLSKHYYGVLRVLKHVATGIFRRMNQSTFKFRKTMFFWICFMVIRVCAFNMLNHQSTFGVQVLLDIWVQPTLRGEEPTAESCGRKGRKTPEQQLAWFQWTLCSGVALLVFDVKHDFDLPAWTLLDVSNRDKQDPKYEIWFVLQFEQGLNLCNLFPGMGTPLLSRI